MNNTDIDVKEVLGEVIAAKPMLQHEFYQRWQRGELSHQELQGYAKEYYAFEKEFPCFLSALHSRIPNPEFRKAILENLLHEEAGPESHPELWLQFAEAVGVDREEVRSHFHSDETQHLLRVFRKHAASDSLVDGIAALYAYESQQPEIAKQKREGLCRWYNVEDGKGVAFFRAHETYDVEHSDTEIKMLQALCNDEVSVARAQKAVSEVLDALYEFLDGVQKRYRPAAA